MEEAVTTNTEAVRAMPAPAVPAGFVCGFAFHEGRAAALDWPHAAGLAADPAANPLWPEVAPCTF